MRNRDVTPGKEAGAGKTDAPFHTPLFLGTPWPGGNGLEGTMVRQGKQSRMEGDGPAAPCDHGSFEFVVYVPGEYSSIVPK